jgi:hypothetical protein
MRTDNNGNSFPLTGDTAKVSEHIGHEVKITGTTTSASANGGAVSGSMGQTGSSAQQAIEVSSVSISPFVKWRHVPLKPKPCRAQPHKLGFSLNCLQD